MHAAPSDNHWVEQPSCGNDSIFTARNGPFVPGALVIVTLHNPREKFWGMILSLTQEGFSLSGADLASFEDIAAMVKDGEPFTPAIVFFPMHRIERVDMDVSDGNLSSLAHRFQAKTGLAPSAALKPSWDRPSSNHPLDSAPRASEEQA